MDTKETQVVSLTRTERRLRLSDPGPELTFSGHGAMSASEGKADINWKNNDVRK